jgi:hypothetical protein
MLHKMHRQLALIHFTAEHKGWHKLQAMHSGKGMWSMFSSVERVSKCSELLKNCQLPHLSAQQKPLK